MRTLPKELIQLIRSYLPWHIIWKILFPMQYDLHTSLYARYIEYNSNNPKLHHIYKCLTLNILDRRIIEVCAICLLKKTFWNTSGYKTKLGESTINFYNCCLVCSKGCMFIGDLHASNFIQTCSKCRRPIAPTPLCICSIKN